MVVVICRHFILVNYKMKSIIPSFCDGLLLGPWEIYFRFIDNNISFGRALIYLNAWKH